jgi:hypothetical protein
MRGRASSIRLCDVDDLQSLVDRAVFAEVKSPADAGALSAKKTWRLGWPYEAEGQCPCVFA